MHVLGRVSLWAGRLLGGLCLVAVVGTAGAAYGQAPADTSTGDAAAGQMPVAPLDTVRAEDVARDDTDRALVRADSLSALVRNGQRLQELFRNVRVRQDTTRLRSNYALRYLDRDELLFTGDVVIYERGDTLRADTVRYNKRTKVGRARSNVRLTDGEVVVRAPRAIYYTEEKRSVFPDSVTLVDSTRILRARTGTYWSEARRAEFQGHVQLTDPETHLEADSLTYYRDRERSIARGRVFIRRMGDQEAADRDTTRRTYLFGQWADNQEQARYSRVQGRAMLVRVRMDSTGAPEDTLVVRGRRLEAFRTDTHRRLIAVDSVRIWQRDLAAVADSAVYDRVIATGPLDTLRTPRPVPTATAPAVPTAAGPAADSEAVSVPSPDTTARGPDTTQAVLDSIARRPPTPPADSAALDTAAVADTARTAPDTTATRWTTPQARREEQLPLEETRLYQAPVTWFDRSQVWGDSIRVRARERRLDTVFVRGRAFAAQRDSTIDRIQQLKGKDLTALFQRDSLRRIDAGPNALAIRFLKTKKGTLKGAAKVSGDRIVLRFRNGEVTRTSVLGGVQSTYYRTPEAVPNPFHLSGFQWTPERRPTRQGLLREGRVRERLRLQPAPPVPLAEERRPGAPADSTQGTTSRLPSDASRRPPRPEPTRSLPALDSTRVPVDSLRVPRRSAPRRDSSQTSPPRP